MKGGVKAGKRVGKRVAERAGKRAGKRAASKSVSGCVQKCSGLAPPFRRRLWPLCSMNRTTPVSKGTRQMFERMSEIRAKRRQRWLDEGRREGRQEGRREGRQEGRREGRRQERARVRAELQRLGVTLPQETIDYLDGKNDESEQLHGC